MANIIQSKISGSAVTAIESVKEFEFAAPGERAALAEDELRGLGGMTFNRIKMPSGDMQVFKIDTGDGNDFIKEIRGIIIDHYPVNAYWAKEYDGSSLPPDCSSMDGAFGVDSDGGTHRCDDSCPYNQYGSGIKGGKGKACKNMHRLFIMTENDEIPTVLTVPPSSLKSLTDYIRRKIVLKKLRTYEVVTTISLKQATSSTGILYSQLAFNCDGKIPDEIEKTVEAFAYEFRSRNRPIVEIDDYKDKTLEEESV